MVLNRDIGSFTPELDIPSLHGKVILVTGGNAGLGKQAVLEYARHYPRRIWLAARDLDKAKAAVDEIHAQVADVSIKPLQMDLTTFQSVQKAVKQFTAEEDRLDILMLNAGIMASAPGLTEDGYEIQFGTNHMGHALLTKLLIPVLDKTVKISADGDVRIVSLSSTAHQRGPQEGIDFGSLKMAAASNMGPYIRYGQSKLANVLFVRQLAKLYPQFTVVAVHPGVVKTGLVSGTSGLPFLTRILATLASYFFTPVDQGARNQLWASVSKNVKSGEYYEPVGISGRSCALGKDDDLAKALWDWTERELASVNTQ